ncbi:MAG TPA: hypothetical protein VNC84_05075 [Gammaproteobacteria bacterium]|jgi:hypothetical protein|nr:hypothetical protein [Gammaproteobacteria bacterium]
MDFIGKLKKLFLLLITLISFSACSVSQNYQTTTSARQFTATEQLAVIIKKDINRNASHQNQKKHHQVKIYTKYIDGLIEQIKEKKISEEDAHNLLIKSYRQFKSEEYSPQKESTNKAPNSEETPTSHYIPSKPGRL